MDMIEQAFLDIMEIYEEEQYRITKEPIEQQWYDAVEDNNLGDADLARMVYQHLPMGKQSAVTLMVLWTITLGVRWHLRCHKFAPVDLRAFVADVLGYEGDDILQHIRTLYKDEQQ